ncbi:MAG: 50S ribosomal protein L5 [Thaumarchaeota archaeon]|nr:50S ribosomal protein L5 [Candidatus Calditenuaceae archaeon]MDW8041472.1 50S ribosomal protein L5 [Nitrososphaerota archaeon]
MAEATLTAPESSKALNPMRRLRVEKVVVNCSVGESGVRLERASKILESLTGQKPLVRKAKKTIKGFGIHKGEPIAVMVTLRHEKAVDFLKTALEAVKNTLRSESFDTYGNFSFGVKEHLDMPGTRYDPELGMIGFDVVVHVTRPGLRVQSRRIKRSKIPVSHRPTKEESIEFVRREFGVNVV